MYRGCALTAAAQLKNPTCGPLLNVSTPLSHPSFLSLSSCTVTHSHQRPKYNKVNRKGQNEKNFLNFAIANLFSSHPSCPDISLCELLLYLTKKKSRSYLFCDCYEIQVEWTQKLRGFSVIWVKWTFHVSHVLLPQRGWVLRFFWSKLGHFAKHFHRNLSCMSRCLKSF